MTIRPIDLQVLIPRTEEINRNQQNHQERNQAGAEKFMLQFQEEVRHRKNQVINSHKSEQEKINSEKREQQNQRRGKQKKEQRTEEKQEEITDPTKGTLIDITT